MQTMLWPSLLKRAPPSAAPSITTARKHTARLCIHRLSDMMNLGFHQRRLNGRLRSRVLLKAGHQRQQRTEDDNCDAYPDPVHQRIQKYLNDGPVGVGVFALVDDIEIALQRRMQCDHRGGCLAGEIESLLRRKLRDLFAVFVHVEKRVFRVEVRLALLSED